MSRDKLSWANLDVEHDAYGYFTILPHLNEKSEIQFKVRSNFEICKNLKIKTWYWCEWSHESDSVISISVGGMERPEISFEYLMSPFGVIL